jgi:hypothetical protein
MGLEQFNLIQRVDAYVVRQAMRRIKPSSVQNVLGWQGYNRLTEINLTFPTTFSYEPNPC